MRLARVALAAFVLGCASAPEAIEGEPDGASRDLCDALDEPLDVHEIQGPGAESLLRGERVSAVCGLVVLASGDVLYLETLPSRRDSNRATAESLKVDLTQSTAGARRGDVVAVQGIVEERRGGADDLPETVLMAEDVRWLGTTTVPAPISAETLFEPLEDGSAPDVASFMARYESLESSRIRLERPVVVGPTHHGILALATDTVLGRLGRTVAGGLPSPDGALAEPLLVDAPSGVPNADVGDVFDGVIQGIVFHRDGRYRLNLVPPLPALIASARPSEQALAADAEALTIATLNLAVLGDSDVARVDRFADLIARRLGGPDILALQEVAARDPEQALTAFAHAIRERGGPDYEVVAQAGATPDFGPLRLGLLVARGKVDVVRREGTGPARFDARAGVLAPSPGHIEPDSAAFDNSRIPLAVELCAGGRQVIVVVVHLTSRLDDDPLMGPEQPPMRHSVARRVAQAQRIVELTGAAVRAGRAVVVLGDFNDTPGSETLRLFESAAMSDLATTLGAGDRYSYVFEGASALLDHVLASSALEAGAVVDVVHGNADRAEARRDTDHDPLVARIDLGPASGCVGVP